MDPDYMPFAFLLFFAGMWFGVSTLLSGLSGWFVLMRRFPDKPEEAPVLTLKSQSGSMGVGVNMRNILNLYACPSGLRVGILRLFGPFSRDFLVPWSQLTVERSDGWLGRRATLRFGDGKWARLVIEANVADALWRAVPNHWPEGSQPPVPETPKVIVGDLFRKFALTCAFMWLAFFVIFPTMGGPRLAKDPAFLFAMFVFFPGVLAVSFAWEYHKRSRR